MLSIVTKFLISFTSDMSKSMQAKSSGTEESIFKSKSYGSTKETIPGQEMFIWNRFASKPSVHLVDKPNSLESWIVPIVHGHVYQKLIKLGSNRNLSLRYTLIGEMTLDFYFSLAQSTSIIQVA